MSSDGKKTLAHLTLKSLQIVATPYRRLLERRQLAREIQEAQRNIAEETDKNLANFHEALWSRWPDAVQHVRQYVSKKENYNE